MADRPPRRARAAPRRVHQANPDAWRARRPKGEARRLLRGLCKDAGSLLPDWRLISEGDRVLVALSGGKDSFAMLEVLLELGHRAPVSFELGAVVVDPGFPGFDAAQVARLAGDRGVQTWVAPSDIGQTLESLHWRRAPCALCSRLRRGVLYRAAGELGFSTLALGHHADDAIETALMNLFFNGQLRAMAPRYQPDVEGAPAVIRPLLATVEARVTAYAEVRGFQRVESACPLCAAPETERLAIKHLMIELAAEHPRIRQSVLAALGNVSPGALMDRSLQRRLAPGEHARSEGASSEPPRAAPSEPPGETPGTS